MDRRALRLLLPALLCAVALVRCGGSVTGTLDNPDSGSPDSGSPDGGHPDSGSPDSGSPDSGSPDGGHPDSGSPDSGSPDSGSPDAGGSPDGGVTLQGSVSGVIRVDNFGWRTGDSKVAVLLGHAGQAVQLHSAGDGSLVASYTSSALQAADDDSGDQASLVDFSAVHTPGDYYLSLPGAQLRSYTFRIADDVYDIVGAASMKSYYYQRCNHDKDASHATDALLGFPGKGGTWTDAACHTGDISLSAGPGSPDHGKLDLHGGWHDAGDYQKTLWGRGVPQLLFAWEINSAAWRDGQLNIPESQNGIPDLLDEVKWELDFYLRMQRPDGHFMTSAKGKGGNTASPPSASDEGRVYFDTTSPDGNGWSGGGVTLGAATGNAVLALAHAAIVFKALGQTSTAQGYQTAASNGWTWLNAWSAAAGSETELKAAAAAAVFRMDSTNSSAKSFAESFSWSTFDGLLPYSVTPAEDVISLGAWHYLLNAQGSTQLKSTIRTAVGQALVDTAFQQAGVYGGLFGNSGNAWDWGWGSNRSQANYGANLFMAAHFGITGQHTADEVTRQAQKYLHFLLGLNPLNMVYLTNMAAYGGEHSSFQIYHSWFSYTGGDGDHGNATYNGKPGWVNEPLWPYYPDDNQTSTDGPAPGILPGGPSPTYDGSYVVPHKNEPAYAYRDFSVGCAWNGSSCAGASWELTEPDVGYQGPFVLLVSFLMTH